MNRFLGFTLLVVLCVVGVNGDCTSDIFGNAQEGETKYAACDLAYDGYRFAVCTGGTFGEPDTTHCTSRTPTIFSYGIASVVYSVGSPISALSLRTDGVITVFTITPELPAGLSLNAQDGSISGQPTSPMEETTFTVSGGELRTTIRITVNLVMCAALDTFPAVSDGETSSSSSACPAGFGGTATRLCTNGVFGDLDVSGCTPLSPSSLAYTGVTSGKRGDVLSLVPTYSNTAESFTISPLLPTGLTMTSMGLITGVPTGTPGTTYHTVTATGVEGTTPTQTILTITIGEAQCSGLQNDAGQIQIISHGSSLLLECPEGYTGTVTRICTDGVYEDANTQACQATSIQNFAYASSALEVVTGVHVTFGLPSFVGIANFFTVNPPLPEGFTLNEETGEVSGMSNEEVMWSGTIKAKASSTAFVDSTTTLSLYVKQPACEATKDFPSVPTGSSSTYKCPEGYEGTMKRKCTRVGDAAVWEVPTGHCQEVQKYTFIYIGLGVMAVCLVFLFIGCCVKSSRERAKNKKSLKPAPRPAPKPVMTVKTPAKKVTI